MQLSCHYSVMEVFDQKKILSWLGDTGNTIIQCVAHRSKLMILYCPDVLSVT